MTASPTTIRGRFQIAVTGAALALAIPAFSGWHEVNRLAEDADRTVQEAVSAQRLTARFTAAAVQAMNAGQGYVANPSDALRREFADKGRAAHDLAQALSQAATASTAVLSAVARLDHDLSRLENRLVRAHLHADLGEFASARRELDRSAPFQDSMLRAVRELGDSQAAYLSAATDSMRGATQAQGVAYLVTLLVTIGIVVLVARWLARAVAQPLSRLVAHASAIAERRSDAHTPVESVPGEFGALAIAMNEAGESLVRLAEAEEAANRNRRLASVGRLASGVAHELNNPLHTILLTAGLLQEDVSDPTWRRELDVIRAQADRARGIVRDLMNSTRDESRPREVVPADSIVRRAEDELARLAAAHGATLVVDLPCRSLPSVEVDRSDLTRLLGILVSNGAHAAGSGGTVRIRAEAGEDACRFVVEDDGPGLTDEVAARLFEPFFTTKPVGQGTGLGLPVALGIAESHGGTLAGANRADQRGASFTATIPFKLDRPMREPPSAGRALAPAPPPIPGTERPPVDAASEDVATPRALVVDDEETVRAVLGKILARADWRVDEASHGQEALAMIAQAETAQDAYTFILCDLRMPVLSGIALHDILAERYPASLERFTIASGDLASPDVVDLLDRTRCPVMEKPLDMKAVLRLASAARATPPGGTLAVR